mmetsp:Transcript_27260/g.44770  ORF Transcript_27260/g.44770 Transcript_27260/m.44770 type:complete len:466 (-) Transcript_27260:74-1471(-)
MTTTIRTSPVVSEMNQTIDPDLFKKMAHRHYVDSDLLKYCKRINHYAFVAFALIIFINLIYFFLYGFTLKRWIIFPVTEYFVFDVRNDWLSSILWTMNWILLFAVIFTQIRLQEMHINLKSILKAFAMFFCLNLFGTIHSILIMYPLVTILNYTYYYKFKSRLRYFIHNCLVPIDEASDCNDKYLRLIAVNHFLSKLCHQLQTYTVQRKQQRINNITVYHRLHEKLGTKLFSLLRELKMTTSSSSSSDTSSPASTAAVSSSSLSPLRAESVYHDCIESELESQRVLHRAIFRLYAFCINLSLLRCLFFSDGLNLYEHHFAVYNAFWIKLAFEVTAAFVLMVWSWCDGNIQKIKQNELKTRFYYIVLKLPEFKCIDGLIYDNLLLEADRFYNAWKFALDAPFVSMELTKYVPKCIAGTICDHLFETKVNRKRHKQEQQQQQQQFELNPMFWEKIVQTLQQNERRNQ